jgi:hypothetical protein
MNSQSITAVAAHGVLCTLHVFSVLNQSQKVATATAGISRRCCACVYVSTSFTMQRAAAGNCAYVMRAPAGTSCFTHRLGIVGKAKAAVLLLNVTVLLLPTVCSGGDKAAYRRLIRLYQSAVAYCSQRLASW